MKIGIITEFDSRSTNYGNTLQAFALQKRLADHDFNCEVITFDKPRENENWDDRPFTSFLFSLRSVPAKAKSVIKRFLKLTKSAKTSSYDLIVDKRLVRFREFQDKFFKTDTSLVQWKDLENASFDAYIVGSDVVWSQKRGSINRAKFLDFSAKKPFKKIAYAASMTDFKIPFENIGNMKRSISSFDAVSLRENCGVELFSSLGIGDFVKVADPTLLLSRLEWQKIEDNPFLENGVIANRPFVFVYLLGARSQSEANSVRDWAHGMGMTIVDIPYTSWEWAEETVQLGDVHFEQCSPSEWIWLIDNAEYVLTDSFHGIALSTLLRTKFLSLSRGSWEARVIDFLQEIGEEDKFIELDRLNEISEFNWDFESMEAKLKPLTNRSLTFLQAALA